MVEDVEGCSKEEVEGSSRDAVELTDENLEEVAGGQTNCIPKEPITDTLFPMTQPVPIERTL